MQFAIARILILDEKLVELFSVQIRRVAFDKSAGWDRLYLDLDADVMKSQNFRNSWLALAAIAGMAFSTLTVSAQDSGTTDSASPPTAVSQSAPQLPYGVPQVLQLTQAKVSDSVIINYIQHSGNSYGLDANQIIYLRNQGVSDPVINAMLNQPKSIASSAEAAATETSTAAAQPTVTYVQTVPSSSVYVIPDTQTYQYDGFYYNYNYPYYVYPYPAVSFSFGFGGPWHGGYYHGGGFHGGGWHGGGGWHH
jgi:hypothetical protein